MKTKSLLLLLMCMLFAGCETSTKKPAAVEPAKSETPEKENPRPEAGQPVAPVPDKSGE